MGQPREFFQLFPLFPQGTFDQVDQGISSGEAHCMSPYYPYIITQWRSMYQSLQCRVQWPLSTCLAHLGHTPRTRERFRGSHVIRIIVELHTSAILREFLSMLMNSWYAVPLLATFWDGFRLRQSGARRYHQQCTPPSWYIILFQHSYI